jgi:tetratricopeptide (TPR) repeat protein
MRDPDELKGATDALETLGIYDQAIVGLNRLAELSPSSSTAHSHMASLYGILRRFRNAEVHARLAVEVDPENPMGHYYLGMALNELDRTEEALVCFKKARSLGLQLPDAYFPAEVPKTKDDQ